MSLPEGHQHCARRLLCSLQELLLSLMVCLSCLAAVVLGPVRCGHKWKNFLCHFLTSYCCMVDTLWWSVSGNAASAAVFTQLMLSCAAFEMLIIWGGLLVYSAQECHPLQRAHFMLRVFIEVSDEEQSHYINRSHTLGGKKWACFYYVTHSTFVVHFTVVIKAETKYVLPPLCS